MTTVAIIQPCYLPWRGYFDIINKSDVFVFADNLQYNKQNWRNRNKIKTRDGARWLTVPVTSKSRKGRANINEVAIDYHIDWPVKHWNLIVDCYGKAPFFEFCATLVKDILFAGWELLVDLDIQATLSICELLKINTRFLRASELGVYGRKTEYIVNICEAVGADTYLSGPSAQIYMDEAMLEKKGIRLVYQDYEYPMYPQCVGETFLDNLSVIDLLFNCGDTSPDYIWNAWPRSMEYALLLR
jgi:hypothetical protein